MRRDGSRPQGEPQGGHSLDMAGACRLMLTISVELLHGRWFSAGLLVVPPRPDRRDGRTPRPRRWRPRPSAARARAIVMETERRLGFEPTDRELSKLGYDIESRVPAPGRCGAPQVDVGDVERRVPRDPRAGRARVRRRVARPPEPLGASRRPSPGDRGARVTGVLGARRLPTPPVPPVGRAGRRARSSDGLSARSRAARAPRSATLPAWPSTRTRP